MVVKVAILSVPATLHYLCDAGFASDDLPHRELPASQPGEIPPEYLKRYPRQGSPPATAPR